MDVSIIIVNYHTEDLIKDAIDSILEKTRDVSCEIIVVDSAPDDHARKILGGLDPRMPYRYLELEENIGFGRANNEGFRYATGKYLFCLNPDTLLVNNAVKILYDFMESHPRCGACGGNLFHDDMRPTHPFRRILPGILWELSDGMKRFPEHVLFGRNSKFNHSGRPKKVGYITGADLMLRAALIKEIGAFAPEFFMYFEETDLCCRIRKAGYDIFSVPDAKIIHLEGKSMSGEEVNTRKFRYYADSRVEYYKRNVPLRKAVRAFRIFLRNLRKEAERDDGIGEIARCHYQCALEALERYPELNDRLFPARRRGEQEKRN